MTNHFLSWIGRVQIFRCGRRITARNVEQNRSTRYLKHKTQEIKKKIQIQLFNLFLSFFEYFPKRTHFAIQVAMPKYRTTSTFYNIKIEKLT